MHKTLSMGLALGLFGLFGGCGSDTKYDTPYCVNGESGAICDPPGFPLVTFAQLRTDACPNGGGGACARPVSATTATLTQTETGKLCVKGTVAGPEGFTWLILGVGRWNQPLTRIFGLLDAKALGISALRISVDDPPAAGLSLFATTAHTTSCPAGPPSCLGEGWSLRTGPRSNLVKPIDMSGPLDAPFTNFARIDPNEAFDTTHIHDFIFVVSPGNYDFCVSELKFLDSQGVEVSAPPSADAGAP